MLHLKLPIKLFWSSELLLYFCIIAVFIFCDLGYGIISVFPVHLFFLSFFSLKGEKSHFLALPSPILRLKRCFLCAYLLFCPRICLLFLPFWERSWSLWNIPPSPHCSMYLCSCTQRAGTTSRCGSKQPIMRQI